MDIKDFFNRIGRLFKMIAAPLAGPKVTRVLNQVEDLVPDALLVVTKLARLTPNRTDDEIAQAATVLAPVAIDFIRDLPRIRPEDALCLIAREALKQQTKRLNIPESTLNASIELAYSIYKATKND